MSSPRSRKSNESPLMTTANNEELKSLDLYSKAEAERRTEALLRAMLGTAPAPFTPKPKKKRAKRAK